MEMWQIAIWILTAGNVAMLIYINYRLVQIEARYEKIRRQITDQTVVFQRPIEGQTVQ